MQSDETRLLIGLPEHFVVVMGVNCNIVAHWLVVVVLMMGETHSSLPAAYIIQNKDESNDTGTYSVNVNIHKRPIRPAVQVSIWGGTCWPILSVVQYFLLSIILIQMYSLYQDWWKSECLNWAKYVSANLKPT